MSDSPTQNQDIVTFVNPRGYWEYEGAYSAELTPDARWNLLVDIPSIRIEGHTVHVPSGRAHTMMFGIQLWSLGEAFYFTETNVKVIRDGNGDLLWVKPTPQTV